MIRRMKYLKREETELFVEKFPPHSCLIWDKRAGDCELFDRDTDKVLGIDSRVELDHSAVVEFVIINNSKTRSNTTLYCEDYTLCIFFDKMLSMLPGRLHLAGEDMVQRKDIFENLKQAYADYVLEGIL
tara:strand:- start:455 stop:841 length:387 start_codon:yes stop_codon:yes gene_type:complete